MSIVTFSKLFSKVSWSAQVGLLLTPKKEPDYTLPPEVNRKTIYEVVGFKTPHKRQWKIGIPERRKTKKVSPVTGPDDCLHSFQDLVGEWGGHLAAEHSQLPRRTVPKRWELHREKTQGDTLEYSAECHSAHACKKPTWGEGRIIWEQKREQFLALTRGHE